MNTNENSPTDKIVDQTDVLDTLPCPFCGGMDLKIGRSPANFFWVYCLPCHIRRHTDTSKDAVLEWNRRQEAKMTKWFKKFFRVHTHEWTEPLIVSGYGYTEYEIRFCKSSKCLKCEGKLTKQLW